MLLLLRAVYPRAIVDQITVRGNGRENPVEIGLLVIVLSKIEKKVQFLCFQDMSSFSRQLLKNPKLH